MTAEEYIEQNVPSTCIVLPEWLQEFAKIKVKEALEIAAGKAKIIDEDGDIYDQPHVFYCNGEEYKNWVDRDSIINCIDLDEFIK